MQSCYRLLMMGTYAKTFPNCLKTSYDADGTYFHPTPATSVSSVEDHRVAVKTTQIHISVLDAQIFKPLQHKEIYFTIKEVDSSSDSSSAKNPAKDFTLKPFAFAFIFFVSSDTQDTILLIYDRNKISWMLSCVIFGE